jgi:M6 family metalloprotease-like protein
MTHPDRPVRPLALLAFALSLLALPLFGAPLKDVPQTLVQPDGSVVNCFASGDEFYHWLHDASGYPIVQDPATGAWVYACPQNGEPQPTALWAGKADPAAAGILPGPGLSPSRYQAIRDSWPGGSAARPEEILQAPHTGRLNSVTIFIRFSGEAEFTDSISFYDNIYNSSAGGFNSLRNYFMDASYGKIEILSTFYPIPTGTTVVSYQDTYPRNYYQKKSTTNPDGYVGSSQRNAREWTLLQNAVVAIASQVPADLVIDGDGDGFVDSVSFVISGAPDGWNDLLWPHMWSLGSGFRPTINGKTVLVYDFQLQTSVHSDGNGVLCHEMFHVLGSPDLYHYSYDGLSPTYSWDIMENTANPPQHMGAYMKFKYGHWIDDIPEISAAGTYSLNPLTSPEGQCFKIPCPASPAEEFFVVEFRKKLPPFENRIPGSGLLVYRINPNYTGNAGGPPDEVYIYRPGGSPEGNGSPSSAHFTVDACRTALTDTTITTTDYLTDGSLGGLVLSHVGTAAGNTISFEIGNVQTCVITCSASADPLSGPAPLHVSFDASDRSCDCEQSPDYSWDFGDGTSTQDDYPAHVYTQPGTYTYTFTALGDGGVTCAQQGTIVVAQGCENLSCAAQASPETGPAPLAVAFTATASGSSCENPAFSWAFGDGATSTQQNPTHIYAAAGSYSWTLTVSAGGKTCSQSGAVTVQSACALSCAASASPDTGHAPLSVQFSGSVTNPGCSGSPLYSWAFGDGATSADENPVHVYPAEGSYPWTLTVSQNGKTCTQSGTVAVLAPLKPGDCDGNGTISIGEVQKAINMFLGLTPPACGADCNGDGTVSIGEVQKVINGFLGLASSC